MGGRKLYENGLFPKMFVEYLDEAGILTTGNCVLKAEGTQGHQLQGGSRSLHYPNFGLLTAKAQNQMSEGTPICG